MGDVFMWSPDEESYFGSKVSTEQEAIAEAVSENNLDEGDTVFVSKMERLEPPAFSDRFDACTIAEWLDDYICDNNLSGYEDTHFPWTDEDRKELELALDSVFRAFLSRKPHRFVEYYLAVAPKKVVISKATQPEDA